jgi:hypothetical protein
VKLFGSVLVVMGPMPDERYQRSLTTGQPRCDVPVIVEAYRSDFLARMISVPSSFATHTLGASMRASSVHTRPEAADAGAAGTDGRWSRLRSAVPAPQRQPDRWPTGLLTSCWSVTRRWRQGRALRWYRDGLLAVR